MKKINAFTIVELLVALSIGSIIISFSVMIVMNISQVVDHNSERINKQLEVLGFKESLQNDLYRSVAVVSVSTDKVVLRSSHNNLVTYKVRDEKVIREVEGKGHSSSFRTGDVKFKKEKQEQYIIISAIDTDNEILAFTSFRFSPKHIFESQSYLKDQESEYFD